VLFSPSHFETHEGRSRDGEDGQPLGQGAAADFHGNQAAAARTAGSGEADPGKTPTVVAAARPFHVAFRNALAVLADAGNHLAVDRHVASRSFTGLAHLHDAVSANGSAFTLAGGRVAGLVAGASIGRGLGVALLARIHSTVSASRLTLALAVAELPGRAAVGRCLRITNFALERIEEAVTALNAAIRVETDAGGIDALAGRAVGIEVWAAAIQGGGVAAQWVLATNDISADANLIETISIQIAIFRTVHLAVADKSNLALADFHFAAAVPAGVASRAHPGAGIAAIVAETRSVQ